MQLLIVSLPMHGRVVEHVDINDDDTIANMAPTKQHEALETIAIKLSGVYAAVRAGGSALLGGFANGGLQDYVAATQIALKCDRNYCKHA